ncbi:MAG TPA: hypothetical protein VFP55_08890 [Solirubrobacteraceae bacterium]|nr:hypothetical protein [Solirubrobacteraceae bacterium]
MSEILRPGLLDGLSVALERLGPVSGESLTEVLSDVLSALGASLRSVDGSGDRPEGCDALVLDCAGWGQAGGAPTPGGADPLLRLLDDVWGLTMAVAVDGLIARRRGGRIVFIAPVVGSRNGAAPAAAALENLSRTLSVEWARHAITAVTLVPGPGTHPDHLATVVAYLLSPAGAYFSGARLEIGALSR